jgi:hypothetical protein
MAAVVTKKPRREGIDMSPSWRQVIGECITAFADRNVPEQVRDDAVKELNRIADHLQSLPEEWQLRLPTPKTFFGIVGANAERRLSRKWRGVFGA